MNHSIVVNGRKATHYCNICGALWILWPAGEIPASWSLASQSCGKCCDNEPMGDQIKPLYAEQPKHEPVTFEQAWAQKVAEGYSYGRDALEQVRFGWELREQFAAPPAIPEGYALVPIEPTWQMAEAGSKAAGLGYRDMENISSDGAERVWSAMLAAAKVQP